MASPDLPPNAAYAYLHYTNAGVPPAAAAGLVGNLMQESGGDLNPDLTGDKGNAYGVAQFNGPRKAAYLAYAKAQNKPASDLATQLDYTMVEAGQGEGKAWSQMWNAKDPGQAALITSARYERPGIPNNPARVANAQRVYAAMTGPDAPTLYAEPPKAEQPAPDKPAPAATPAPSAPDKPASDPNIDWLQSMAPPDKSADAPADKPASDPNIDWLQSMAPTPKPEATPTGRAWAPKRPAVPVPDNPNLDAIGNGIASGVKAGFGSGPLLNTDMFQSPSGGVSQAIDTVANHTIGPVLSLAGRGLGAITGGVEGGLQAGGNMIDPSGRLGADAAGMVEALPMMPEANMLAATRGASPGAAVAADRPALPPPAEVPRLEPPMNRASMPAPAPAVAGAANDGSLSAAATPQALTVMTAKEASRIGAREAQQRLTNGPPQGQDLTEYVPGSVPIPAQYEGTAKAATDHRTMVAGSEAYRNRVTPVLQAQNDARKSYFEDMAGDPVVTGNMRDDASAAFDASTAEALKNATGPADPKPVMDIVNSIIKSPRGVDPVVKNKMAQVAEILTDPETGKPYTDPSMLYGARNAIRTMLSKVGPLIDPANRETVIELRAVQKAIDGAIEPVASGYAKGLSDYHTAMGPIEEQEVLQDQFPKIVNSSGNITPDAFRNAMKRIVTGRNASGINPAKSISDETMAKLWNLYSDTQRDTNMGLGKGIGSDTVQKGMNVLNLGRQMVTGAARGSLAAHTYGASEVVLTPLTNMLSGRRMNGKINDMLKPPPRNAE